MYFNPWWIGFFCRYQYSAQASREITSIPHCPEHWQKAWHSFKSDVKESKSPLSFDHLQVCSYRDVICAHLCSIYCGCPQNEVAILTEDRVTARGDPAPTAPSWPRGAEPPQQEVRHLLHVDAGNTITGFPSPNRCQELPAAAEQWEEGKPARPAHQPHHLPAPQRRLHGVPVPGVGQQWSDAAGLAGGQPGAQGAVGHRRGPGQGVEGGPHHPAQLRHGVPGKMWGEVCVPSRALMLSVVCSQGPFVIRECG